MGYRDSSCCCSPCSCSCSIFKVLLSVVVVLGVVVLVLWLVSRPHEIVARVDEADVYRFWLADNDTLLKYDLRLNISVWNPNKRMSFYYDSVEAVARYAGYCFGYDGGLPAFHQGGKNTTVLHPTFAGQKALAAADRGRVRDTLLSERSSSMSSLSFDVQIHAKVRFKVWFFKSRQFTPKFECVFQPPAPTVDGNIGLLFSDKQCDVKFF